MVSCIFNLWTSCSSSSALQSVASLIVISTPAQWKKSCSSFFLLIVDIFGPPRFFYFDWSQKCFSLHIVPHSPSILLLYFLSPIAVLNLHIRSPLYRLTRLPTYSSYTSLLFYSFTFFFLDILATFNIVLNFHLSYSIHPSFNHIHFNHISLVQNITASLVAVCVPYKILNYQTEPL